MSGDTLYIGIRDAIMARWNEIWSLPDIPVLWRRNDPIPEMDPSLGNGFGVTHFMRNEIDFGREEVVAFGGGPGQNLRAQLGSVILRTFTSVTIGDEDDALRLMARATGIFRGYRAQDASGGDLSFLGEGSGFDEGPSDDGIWFTRGCLVVFEYRFLG
jgi:hypothetical protein